MALRLDVVEALARGRALFNERRFWEAHDAWEAAWRVEDGDVRRMLQGLIQVTAGLHNAFVRRRAGSAVKQVAAGLEKLDGIPGEMGGLALERFRLELGATLLEARRWQRGETDGLHLDAVPTLEVR